MHYLAALQRKARKCYICFALSLLSRYVKHPLPDESGSSLLEPGACNGSRDNCEGELRGSSRGGGPGTEWLPQFLLLRVWHLIGSSAYYSRPGSQICMVTVLLCQLMESS